jgi:hypothetical protein
MCKDEDFPRHFSVAAADYALLPPRAAAQSPARLLAVSAAAAAVDPVVESGFGGKLD